MKDEYRKKFPNVNYRVFDIAWEKKPEYLVLLAETLKDPKQCFTGYFQFLIAKLHDVTLERAVDAVIEGQDITKFLSAHEKRKRINKGTNKLNSRVRVYRANTAI